MPTFTATLKILALLSIMGVTGAARAEADGVIGTPASAASVAVPTEPPRDSLPWQLRPLTTGSFVRLETAAAVFNDANGNLNVAVPTMLASSYQLTPRWAPSIRLGFVGNDAPGEATDGSSFVNPLLGATYTRALGASYRLALFGAATLPVGTGGGDAPDIRAAKTNTASVTARPADEAMFAVDDLTVLAGVDFTYVEHGFTAQAEATVLQSVRVRGEGGDRLRTRGALGLHLGYFFGRHFSVGTDVHRGRGTTVAFGPRAHLRVGTRGWLRPGLAFVRGLDARGLDAPLITRATTAILLDVAVTF
jgi:hypothetical protein